jgi:hypothetical protein
VRYFSSIHSDRPLLEASSSVANIDLAVSRSTETQAGDELTDEEIVKTVAAAVNGLDGTNPNLKSIRKISPGSNIWKAVCSTSGLETEFTLYVFPDASPEELSALTKERLILHLPRWQITETG